MCKDKGDQPPSTQHGETSGRYSDSEIERLTAENEAMRAQIAEIKDMVSEIRNVLLGNGTGIHHLVEQLGRCLETMHRQGQLQAQVIESLLSKLQLEKILVDVLAVWQAHSVAQALDGETT